jgi:dTDP-4-dehydrorhamnose 3,5-epimerase
MKFTETPVAGAYVIDIEPVEDDRGFFARTWSSQELAGRGLEHRLVQCSISFNTRRGTLRGMHYQAPPYAEVKLVRCTRGAIFDVIADMREDSPSRMTWTAVELSSTNRRTLYIPRGVAHGFQTLECDTEVFYQMPDPYVAEAARGFHFDDPSFGIRWPVTNPIMSDRDRQLPLFQP